MIKLNLDEIKKLADEAIERVNEISNDELTEYAEGYIAGIKRLKHDLYAKIYEGIKEGN